MSLALGCLIAAGCAQGRLHQAADLPPEYLAAPVENVQTINLSRLVTESVSNELIQPGDVLEVNIESGYAQDKSDSLLVRVGADGVANVPLVGRVALANLKLEGAEQAIAAAAVGRNILRNPSVTAVMKQQRSNKVTVIGAVEEPGVYDLPRGSSSLLAAIVAAGGLSSEAATDVEIRRPAAARAVQSPILNRITAAGYQQPQPPAQPVSYQVNLIDAAKQDHVSHNLEDGDVVMVQRRDPQPFDVIGLVTKPGRFELPPNQDLYLLDALAIAGGVTTHWADKIHVVRQVPDHAEPIVIEISIKEAKRHGKGNIRLGPGDVVSVEPTNTTLVTGAIRTIAPYSLGAIIPFIR